jgi:hypothetical protein
MHDLAMKAIAITILLVGLAIAITVVAALSRWSLLGIRGDGVVKTESREVAEFSKVVVAGGYDIQWTHGKPALAISSDQNVLPHIRTEVSGGALRIDSSENLRPTRGVTITISSESLADVELTGANTLTASQLSNTDLKLEATGASTINLEGSATNLTANLTGASTLRAKSLQTKTVALSLTGASTADVAVSDVLKASLTGACSVTYSGNPKLEDNRITGAGSIHHRE